jgi:hypothetical protein
VEKINHDNRNEGVKRQAGKERNGRDQEERRKGRNVAQEAPGRRKRAKFGSSGRVPVQG